MRQNLLLDEKMQGLIREMNALEKSQNKLKAENYQVKGVKLKTCFSEVLNQINLVLKNSPDIFNFGSINTAKRGFLVPAALKKLLIRVHNNVFEHFYFFS
jgi:hypothetical protein